MLHSTENICSENRDIINILLSPLILTNPKGNHKKSMMIANLVDIMWLELCTIDNKNDEVLI